MTGVSGRTIVVAAVLEDSPAARSSHRRRVSMTTPNARPAGSPTGTPRSRPCARKRSLSRRVPLPASAKAMPPAQPARSTERARRTERTQPTIGLGGPAGAAAPGMMFCCRMPAVCRVFNSGYPRTVLM